MASSSPLLRTESVSKHFGDLVAVDGVTWDLHRGQTKALIGPNGAGKTTFFNLLSGVYRPTAGAVVFDGADITDRSVHERARRGIAKTYQITSVFGESTAFENVRIAAQAGVTTFDAYHGWEDLEAVSERADEVLADLGIEEYRDMPAEQLSYGNQRILEIGMVLATDPEVVLFDEPTAGLAPDAIDTFLTLLREVAARSDLTAVVIEHNIEVAAELAEVLTVMHDGSILAEGDPADVLDNPSVQDVYLEGGR
jgi:branched-chain amino acid transport system ATP-binding protein